MINSMQESNARQSIFHLLDEGSFSEILRPGKQFQSPHLDLVGAPRSFDDGVVIGSGSLQGNQVLIAAQEGRFMGGAVGEVHGAKITGLLELALTERPAAVLLLIDSGGVRLHEANAGLIAVSEIIIALLAVRNAGIPVIALIGGRTGCFGGMGIVARCCDGVVMSEESRLSLSGPEVIETAMGVEEFDSQDKTLVWQTVGGKHRYILGDATLIVEDDITAFAKAALSLMKPVSNDLETLEREHEQLKHRLERFDIFITGPEIWEACNISSVERLPVADIEEFIQLVGTRRASL